MKEISFLIANYNGLSYLKKCLKSIYSQNISGYRLNIILIDNGSTDDSIVWLQKHYPKVSLIKNKNNLGFAKANNQGIRLALKNNNVQFIVTLNNDIELDSNWLKILIQFLNKNKKAGIVVGKMLKLNSKRRFDSAGDYFDAKTLRVFNRGYNKIDRGQYEKIEECFSACAAGAVYRRKVFEKTKIQGEYFDEDFVSYIEDIDLNTRARLLGFKIYYIPKAILYHHGSATSSKLTFKYKELLSRRNRILYAFKNFPFNTMVILVLKYILPTRKGIHYYQKPQKIKQKGASHYLNKGWKFYLKLIYKRYVKGNDRAALLEIIVIQIQAIIQAFTLLPRMITKRKLIQNRTSTSSQEVYSWFQKYSL